MAKVVVLSSLLASIWLPIMAAASPRPQRALARTIRHVAGFNLVYLLLVLYVLPRISH